MIWTVERMTVDSFEEGDCIGQLAVGAGNPAKPLGVIEISEPDPEGWHLGWRQDDEPGKMFHWRGPRTARDTRWFVQIEYVIPELP